MSERGFTIFIRAAGFGALGAVLAAIAPHALYPLRSEARIGFAAAPSATVATGFYGPESTPDGLTFAWTGEAFGLALRGLDRRVPWQLTLRLAAPRPDAAEPELVATVDGAVVTRESLPVIGFVERTIEIAASPLAGRMTSIDFRVTPTFVPGPADTRALGVQIDRMTLRPEAGWPRFGNTVVPLAVIGAGAGMVLGLLGVGAVRSAVMLVAFAVISGLVATQGLSPFVTSAHLPALIGGTLCALLAWLALPRGRPGVAVVVGVTYIAAAIELLLLFHPDMPIGDALFHAHRFQDVLGGRYYFTSITPGDYRFPYAIGLYLFSAPFAAFTSTSAENAALLRMLVVTTGAAAAVLLYRLMMGWRNDPIAAVASVVAFHLLPLSFGVTAVGNLTNVFAQSVAMLALVLAANVTTASRTDRAWGSWLALSLVVCAAFLSHTSTFAVLATQFLLAGGFLSLSKDDGLRRGGKALILATVGAILVALVVYYAHFMDVYREAAARITAEAGRATEAAGGRTPLDRLLQVPEWFTAYYGVPLIALAAAGAVASLRSAGRPASAAGPVLGAWLAGCGLFLVVGIVTPVDMRHALAAMPAVACLAAAAFSHGWQAGGFWRVAAGSLAAWSLWTAIASWLATLSRA